MKNIIFYFFILIPFVGFNQITNHFESTYSKWYVASNFINANQENPSHLGVKTKIWQLEGDTLIDGVVWSKLVMYDDTLTNENDFKGYLKSEGNKVFYKENATDNQQLIYDFDIEVGDSVEYAFKIGNDEYLAWLELIEISTININGGSYKKFTFSEPKPYEIDGDFPITMGNLLQEVWIEGIGSIRGPLFPVNPFMLDSEWGEKVDLTCSFVDETQYYHNNSYSDCYVRDVLGIKDFQKELAKIYPNPIKDVIFITNPSNHAMNIEITNNLGQIILQTELKEGKNQLDLNTLKSGIYFIKLEQDLNFQITKLIKE